MTVNLESWEDLPLLEAVDAIWRQDDPARSRRLKNLADGTAALRLRDPERLGSLRARLSHWLDRLDHLGLQARDVADGSLQARRNPLKLLGFLVRNFLAATFAFPFAVAGAAFWFVPFWLVHAIFVLSRQDKDTGATVKVLASLVFFPLWLVAAVVVAGVVFGGAAAVVVAAVAPGAGLTTRHFFRRRFFAAREVATFVTLSLKGRLVDDLVRERDAFCAEFDAVAKEVEQP